MQNFPTVGLTRAGSIGARVALSLDEAIGRVLSVAEAGWQASDDILIICHGGPFDEPENVAEALACMLGVAGFFGATSIERLPIERAIRAQVQAFKRLDWSDNEPGGDHLIKAGATLF